MRIAIIGPGAIGGSLAGHLIARGTDVVLAARTHFDSLSVELHSGETLRFVPTFLDPSVTMEHPFDWVLVTTKAYDVAGTAPWLKVLVAPKTRVAILQNGVEHRERFQALVPAQQLLPVMVNLPASRTAPGAIQQRGPAMLRVPNDPLGQSFVALFSGTAVDAATTEDFTTEIWRKLTLNAPGAINALLLQPNGIVHNPAGAELMRGVMLETIAVARADGAQVDESLADEILESMRNASPDGVNSLHADRAAGRPMETDARNGAVVRIGRRHNIPTPLNQMAVTLLDSLIQSNGPSPIVVL